MPRKTKGAAEEQANKDKKHRTQQDLPPDDGVGYPKWQFVAAWLPSEGWVVLCPWVRTQDGFWWRPHLKIETYGYGPDSEEKARHYADELNKAIGKCDDKNSQAAEVTDDPHGDGRG